MNMASVFFSKMVRFQFQKDLLRVGFVIDLPQFVLVIDGFSYQVQEESEWLLTYQVLFRELVID